MSYTAITDGSIDQDSPVTESLVTLLRDNPIGIANGDTDAPVVRAGWHPYDKAIVGDSADGEFYDFASDGASSAIETPDFADGYEYAIQVEDYSCTANGDIQVEIFLPTPAAWVTLSSTAITVPVNLRGVFHLHFPRIASFGHAGSWLAPLSSSTPAVLASGQSTVAISGTTASKVSKARISMSLGTTDNGKLYLLRRREYSSG